MFNYQTHSGHILEIHVDGFQFRDGPIIRTRVDNSACPGQAMAGLAVPIINHFSCHRITGQINLSARLCDILSTGSQDQNDQTNDKSN